MNYDLCDALNRKLVKYHQFYDGNWTGKSGYKLPQDFDKVQSLSNFQISDIDKKIDKSLDKYLDECRKKPTSAPTLSA